jgi:hypothetical protein
MIFFDLINFLIFFLTPSDNQVSLHTLHYFPSNLKRIDEKQISCEYISIEHEFEKIKIYFFN